ncbi:MAG: metallophosphatase family protein [Peptococcaceae bacterium]|nr:metallophosphatase family protein [Peptococcaceae bacterium]
MRIAVISDIHGNLYALEAVLRDIKTRGVKKVYCAGDLVGYGPRPNEVIELIKRNNIPTVMGNYDDATGNMRIVCGCEYKDEKALRLGESSIAWTKEKTSGENKAWLRELPGEIRLSVSGMKILLVHGSPRALNEYLYENTAEDYLKELIAENDTDVLVCGHTHLPYVKKVANGYVVNAGSAGKPKHGNPNVTYAIIEAGGDGDLKAEIVEVRYSFEETAREIESSGLPPEFARIIRTGCA